MSHLENWEQLSSCIWTQDLHLLRVLLQYPTTTLGNSNFENFNLSFLKKVFFLKTRKKITSRKLPECEQSFLMRKLAIFESTHLQGWGFHLTNYFTSNELFCNLNFLKISQKKTQKSSFIFNEIDLGILNWRQNFPRVKLLWQHKELQTMQKKINLIFMKIFRKNQKNVISGKLKDLEHFYLEAKFATPERTRTEPHYRDDNFNF